MTPTRRTLLRTFTLPAVIAAAVMLIAACGDSGGGGGASPSPTVDAKQQVKTAWQTFFAGTTTAEQRAALLEDGQQYADQLRALSANPLAKQLKAKVQSVRLESPTQASVRYTILLAGQPVLRDQPGVAVKQDGTWKVGTESFQQLLQLQQGASPSDGSGASPGATSSP